MAKLEAALVPSILHGSLVVLQVWLKQAGATSSRPPSLSAQRWVEILDSARPASRQRAQSGAKLSPATVIEAGIQHHGFGTIAAHRRSPHRLEGQHVYMRRCTARDCENHNLIPALEHCSCERR